jgi:prepilin-type N-terminal cleavage/methylation domain-containing protein
MKIHTTISNKKSAGFTLIELLVVVAIIGMLVSVVMVSLTNARVRSRDAKRLTDMNQIKAGLDLYFLNGAGYPDPSLWVAGSNLTCNGNSIMKIPADALAGFTYTYTTSGYTATGCGGTVYYTYEVQFTTEAKTEIGPAGTYYLSPSGITSAAPF